MITCGRFRINCTLPDDVLNSDMFFNYQDNISKKNNCKYDILDENTTLKDLKNIREVLNKLRFTCNKPIILKGRMVK